MYDTMTLCLFIWSYLTPIEYVYVLSDQNDQWEKNDLSKMTSSKYNGDWLLSQIGDYKGLWQIRLRKECEGVWRKDLLAMSSHIKLL